MSSRLIDLLEDWIAFTISHGIVGGFTVTIVDSFDDDIIVKSGTWLYMNSNTSKRIDKFIKDNESLEGITIVEVPEEFGKRELVERRIVSSVEPPLYRTSKDLKDIYTILGELGC